MKQKLDTVRDNCGLAQNGTYTADNTTTYIQAATTLANADTLLDQALDSAVSNLQGEIDANAGDITEIQNRVFPTLAFSLAVDFEGNGDSSDPDNTYQPDRNEFLDLLLSLLPDTETFLGGSGDPAASFLDQGIAAWAYITNRTQLGDTIEQFRDNNNGNVRDTANFVYGNLTFGPNNETIPGGLRNLLLMICSLQFQINKLRGKGDAREERLESQEDFRAIFAA